MSRDCHGGRLQGMVELAMTALLPDLNPSVLFDDSDDIPDLHATSLSIEKPVRL
jgi:hypothetical protein